METTELYRGFQARIRYSYMTRVYMGEIEGLIAPYIFQADSYPEARKSFRAIVDGYLNSGQVVIVAFAHSKSEKPA